jgi:hypothetical protein
MNRTLKTDELRAYEKKKEKKKKKKKKIRNHITIVYED